MTNGIEKGAVAFAPERYNKRLAIVVPYRNRQEHLNAFIPHMVAYFQRDKLDKNIPVTINIIEQNGNGPFNRGKIKNVGFMLVQAECDYISFHDVDYLPIWADYSWTPTTARLIWHGLTLKEDWDSFFGGVVMLEKNVFIRANGYPNSYWGWGPEDFELGRRCREIGYEFEKRAGTYRALSHRHEGFSAPGVWTEESERVHKVFRERDLRQAMSIDGLHSLEFELIRRSSITIDGRTVPNAWHYLVDIN